MRPTVLAFSVAPTTATVLGEKNTSNGWLPLRRIFFFEGLIACMVFCFRLVSEPVPVGPFTRSES